VYRTLISPEVLIEHLQNPDWLVLDARFSLADSGRGQRDYLVSHIPGAAYVHLDHDLSSPVIPGKTGRHPLPTAEIAANRFGKFGIRDGVQVVVYDDAGGALAAVRVWWMLRWLGHQAVAVLDGGWQAWLAADLPVHDDEETRPQQTFQPQPRPELFLDTHDIERVRLDPAWRVCDARAHERYLGMNETIDPVAGHIPGAISIPYLDNLTPDGHFRDKATLREQYSRLLNDLPAERVVFYCGSGVTSIHNILAMEIAGLGEARLYPGSWSEWIADPARPVANA
jgi:thiosulfate/3-mercaptopyruvate sulfurtransferase